ncbi:hypothetical protein [Cupriavidus necator]
MPKQLNLDLPTPLDELVVRFRIPHCGKRLSYGGVSRQLAFYRKRGMLEEFAALSEAGAPGVQRAGVAPARRKVSRQGGADRRREDGRAVMARNDWTPVELEVLRLFYPNSRTDELAAALGRAIGVGGGVPEGSALILDPRFRPCDACRDGKVERWVVAQRLRRLKNEMVLLHSAKGLERTITQLLRKATNCVVFIALNAHGGPLFWRIVA